MEADKVGDVHPVNQLDSVVFQIRFPSMLSVDRDIASFQEEIRGDYPACSIVSGVQGIMDIPVARNYSFASEDGHWSVSLTIASFTLATSRYEGWKDFSTRATALVAKISKCFGIEDVTRIGIRYVNAIKPSSLGFPTGDLSRLINPRYLQNGVPDEWRVEGFNTVVDYVIDEDVKCRATYGTIQFAGVDRERGFLLDSDVYSMNRTSVGDVPAVMDRLNTCSKAAFRSVATRELQDKVGL